MLPSSPVRCRAVAFDPRPSLIAGGSVFTTPPPPLAGAVLRMYASWDSVAML